MACIDSSSAPALWGCCTGLSSGFCVVGAAGWAGVGSGGAAVAMASVECWSSRVAGRGSRIVGWECAGRRMGDSGRDRVGCWGRARGAVVSEGGGRRH